MIKPHTLNDAMDVIKKRSVNVGECIECYISPGNGGYPRVQCDGKTWRVSRLIMTIKHGPLGKADVVCHKCDNPKCVKPEHLFIGTYKQNIQDAIAKGRFVPPPVHWGPRASDPVPSASRYHSDDGLSADEITKRNKARLSREGWAKNNPDRFKAVRAASNARRRAAKVLVLLALVTVPAMASAIDDLKIFEGFRSEAYLDTMGHFSVGYGRRCDKGAVMTKEQAESALADDIAKAEQGARHVFPTFSAQPQHVQDVLVEAVFQLGASGMRKFVHFGQAIQSRNYELASACLIDSRFHHQTPQRCETLAKRLNP